jgi:hypothetical protein
MARGFESKDVEFQQAERERGRTAGRALSLEEREIEEKRRTLELALSRARAERKAATHPNHRRMLDEAIRALEQEIRGIC